MGLARCVGVTSSANNLTPPSTAVTVSKSSRSWSPGTPSKAGTCPQWCKALSMMPAKSHSALAERFGRTALTIECRLCGVSPSCCCTGGGHAHVQGRTASGDSTGGENISRPGLRSCEPPGFRSDARVCKFHAADHSANVNARLASLRGFGSAASFCVFQTVGPGKSHSIGNGHLPPRLCCRVFSGHW